MFARNVLVFISMVALKRLLPALVKIPFYPTFPSIHLHRAILLLLRLRQLLEEGQEGVDIPVPVVDIAVLVAEIQLRKKATALWTVLLQARRHLADLDYLNVFVEVFAHNFSPMNTIAIKKSAHTMMNTTPSIVLPSLL